MTVNKAQEKSCWSKEKGTQRKWPHLIFCLLPVTNTLCGCCLLKANYTPPHVIFITRGFNHELWHPCFAFHAVTKKTAMEAVLLYTLWPNICWWALLATSCRCCHGNTLLGLTVPFLSHHAALGWYYSAQHRTVQVSMWLSLLHNVQLEGKALYSKLQQQFTVSRVTDATLWFNLNLYTGMYAVMFILMLGEVNVACSTTSTCEKWVLTW